MISYRPRFTVSLDMNEACAVTKRERYEQGTFNNLSVLKDD